MSLGFKSPTVSPAYDHQESLPVTGYGDVDCSFNYASSVGGAYGSSIPTSSYLDPLSEYEQPTEFPSRMSVQW